MSQEDSKLNKVFPALAILALLAGCSTNPRGSVPIVDSGAPVSNGEQRFARSGGYAPAAQAQPRAVQEDSGVVVMVPGGTGSAPLQSYPATSTPYGGATSSAPISTTPISVGPATGSNYPAPAPYSSTPQYAAPAPSGIPRAGGSVLAADEQLDGPVLALLTSAQQQQSGGDLNGASSSLERAQRIAPREPQVLYRLAEVRLAQGDAAQAEQLARRGLTYANGRPALLGSLWNLIAQARERQGDAAGAAQARAQAKVNL
jgi:hypothetical protein